MPTLTQTAGANYARAIRLNYAPEIIRARNLDMCAARIEDVLLWQPGLRQEDADRLAAMLQSKVVPE
ncbi:hypothetical protein [Agromyces sp. NPDC058064]|uniref:hypothetical protein n=1 Tax=Agromyces sp. NPDC058064 TaxID=3346322 RepID=UPI0036DB1F0E